MGRTYDTSRVYGKGQGAAGPQRCQGLKAARFLFVALSCLFLSECRLNSFLVQAGLIHMARHPLFLEPVRKIRDELLFYLACAKCPSLDQSAVAERMGHVTHNRLLYVRAILREGRTTVSQEVAPNGVYEPPAANMNSDRKAPSFKSYSP